VLVSQYYHEEKPVLMDVIVAKNPYCRSCFYVLPWLEHCIQTEITIALDGVDDEEACHLEAATHPSARVRATWRPWVEVWEDASRNFSLWQGECLRLFLSDLHVQYEPCHQLLFHLNNCDSDTFLLCSLF